MSKFGPSSAPEFPVKAAEHIQKAYELSESEITAPIASWAKEAFDDMDSEDKKSMIELIHDLNICVIEEPETCCDELPEDEDLTELYDRVLPEEALNATYDFEPSVPPMFQRKIGDLEKDRAADLEKEIQDDKDSLERFLKRKAERELKEKIELELANKQD